MKKIIASLVLGLIASVSFADDHVTSAAQASDQMQKVKEVQSASVPVKKVHKVHKSVKSHKKKVKLNTVDSAPTTK
jgi:hypothetical protein